MDATAPAHLTWRWRVIARVVIVVVRLLRWRIDVRGLEHVPRRGGAVLAFNHHSYVDFVMVGWPIIRTLRRPLRFLAKREIWNSSKVGWVVRSARAIPVDRSSPSSRMAAFDGAVDALRCGDLVAVAPEQTISPSFELLPLRTGAARMAQAAGVPIVPVAGWGSQRALTKGGPKRLVCKLPVLVRFGAPLHVAPQDDPVAATEELARRLTSLLHDAQQEYPDGMPAGARWVPARLGGGAPDHDEVLRAHLERERGWDEQDVGSGPPDRGDGDGGEDPGTSRDGPAAT
jgi:1-acyl-sn-glycerol-3-phosphate acyltransferase